MSCEWWFIQLGGRDKLITSLEQHGYFVDVSSTGFVSVCSTKYDDVCCIIVSWYVCTLVDLCADAARALVSHCGFFCSTQHSLIYHHYTTAAMPPKKDATDEEAKPPTKKL